MATQRTRVVVRLVALAGFTVTLSGGRGWVPRHSGMFQVSSGWRNEDGYWRCCSATWKRVLR